MFNTQKTADNVVHFRRHPLSLHLHGATAEVLKLGIVGGRATELGEDGRIVKLGISTLELQPSEIVIRVIP